ncbi:unnamed protein product, partial [Effrenium voratum]
MLRSTLVLFLLGASACEDAGCEELSANFLQVSLEANRAQHPWPHARGSVPQHSTTPQVWANQTLSWSWPHPDQRYKNLLAGGAVIDRDENLYVMSAKGLFAISPTGEELWKYSTPGVSNNEPTLFEDLVLGTTKAGYAFAVDRTSGKAVWERQLAASAGPDCGYPAAFDGVFVLGMVSGAGVHTDDGSPPPDGGNMKVLGVNARTGDQLWEYDVDRPVWNLTPLFNGDGTVLFMDFAGSMYRLGLHDGKEVWRSLTPESRMSFSDGGAVLGQNGLVYSCSNYENSRGGPGEKGVARAWKISDGSIAWTRLLDQPCNSYPAVGHVRGSEELAVVFTPGAFLAFNQVMPASVKVMNAGTGGDIWEFHVPDLPRFQKAAGELEGFLPRLGEKIQPFCGPAHWSAPVLDAAGTILVGRSNGAFYRVFGPEELYTGAKSDHVEVNSGILAEVDDMKDASLHGAVAVSPHIFSFTSCDTLYVFKKIISVFANRTGRICMRADADVERSHVNIKAMELGDWLEVLCDFDQRRVSFNLWPANGGGASCATVDFSGRVERFRRLSEHVPMQATGYLA